MCLNAASQSVGMRKKSKMRIGRENLFQSGGESNAHQPDKRHQRDPNIFRPMHFEKNGCAHRERNNGEQLICDAEKSPEGIDAPKRIDHALVKEISPGGDYNGARRNSTCLAHAA